MYRVIAPVIVAALFLLARATVGRNHDDVVSLQAQITLRHGEYDRMLSAILLHQRGQTIIDSVRAIQLDRIERKLDRINVSRATPR